MKYADIQTRACALAGRQRLAVAAMIRSTLFNDSRTHGLCQASERQCHVHIERQQPIIEISDETVAECDN